MDDTWTMWPNFLNNQIWTKLSKVRFNVLWTTYYVCVWRKKIYNCHSSFFSFFPSRHFFWMDCQKLFREGFNFSYQENVWPRFDSFLGHTQKYFRKNCSLSCYSWRVWHMTQLMHGHQHSQHTKKRKKLPEPTTRNLETSYTDRYLVDGRRFKGQNREKSSW